MAEEEHCQQEDPLVQIHFQHDGTQVCAVVPKSLAEDIQRCYHTDPEKHRIYLQEIAQQAKQTKSHEESNSSASTDTTTSIHVWTENEEKFLINLRLENEQAFNGSKSHDQLWNEITVQMNEKRIKVTKVQVINKWKNLKKKYKELLDMNNKTGNSPTVWKYFKVFNEAYGNKASTRPIVAIDSSKDTPVLNSTVSSSGLQSSGTSTSGPSHALGSSSTGTPCMGRKRKRKSNEIAAESSNNNHEILKVMSQHHKEKMKRMDKILNVFQILAGQSGDNNGNNTSDDSDLDL